MAKYSSEVLKNLRVDEVWVAKFIKRDGEEREEMFLMFEAICRNPPCQYTSKKQMNAEGAIKSRDRHEEQLCLQRRRKK